MGLLVYEIEKYSKLPDLAGATYDAIEEFETKSVEKLIKFLKVFLDYSNPEEIEKSPPISTTMLVAPWGLGKTTTYDLHIKNLLKQDRYIGYSIKIRAQDISNFYDTFKTKEEFKLIPGNADRFLLLIVRIILENPEFTNQFSQIRKGLNGKDLVEEVLRNIKKDYNFFLIFIDELEEVVKSKNNIILFILKAIKDLLNGSSNIINNKSNPDLFHFLSFVIACTDAAIYEISRHEQLEYQYGGIKRRIHEERILDIQIEESIEYLLKLNKFCYKGQFTESFVNAGGSFNVLARMAMKNPGYMKSYFTDLMNKSGGLTSGNVMSQIDGRFILENSKNYSLDYMETQRKAINPEIYNNWFEKFKNDNVLLNLLYLFIGEIKAYTINEINKRFEETLTEVDILTAINKFNRYIESIHPNIKNAIISVNLFKNNITRADIQNVLEDNQFPIEETEEFLYAIKFNEREIPLEEFFDSISYFEINEKSQIILKFFFNTDKDILKQLFPYLNNSTRIILRNQFKKHLDLQNEYYIINPYLFSIIFPLPIPQEYNLLKNKNDTVRLWTEISRARKSDIFKTQINEIISAFLSMNQIIKKESNSDVLFIKDFEYFSDILDKKQFIVLENYRFDRLSNSPINVLFWRELSDYGKQTINDITLRVGSYQKNELKNIHLVVLISQNKIPENLITDLSNNLEYSVLKELLLSQFDITKYAFLNEIFDKYQAAYDEEKFKLALRKLTDPFKNIIESCEDDIERKGLTIKLNSYMSPLNNIPQLLKYLLYDFESDFNTWSSVELKKPFEELNPIGLSPRYSSSIDDWSNDTLKSNISNYLLVNNYVKIENNRLDILMPQIERNILQLVKAFDSEKLEFTYGYLKSFFFDKSKTPSLLKEVFIADLENRGLISVEKVKKIDIIKFIKIKDSELEDKFNDIKSRVKLLELKDRNFYHIFTIKQKGYSVVFLKSFLNQLEKLLDPSLSSEFNEYSSSIRKNIFLRIYVVFNKLFSHVFTPLNIKLSNFKEKLLSEKQEKFRIGHINAKLNKFGLTEINIEEFPELKKINDKFSKIIDKIDNPVNIKSLLERAKTYYKINYTNVRVAGEPFSYLKLSQTKGEDFVEPYLNLIYYTLIQEKTQYFNSDIFSKLEEIYNSIKKVDENYLEIKAQFSTGTYSGQLAPIIYKKAESLSDFNFVRPPGKVSNLNEVIKFLNDLNKEISKIHTPISTILKKRGRGKPQSIIDRIYFFEKLIKEYENEIKNYLVYLKQKKILENEELILKLKLLSKLKFSESVQNVENCQNLIELEDLTMEIFNKLTFETDSLKNSIGDIKLFVIQYFKNYRDINSLEKLFKSLNLGVYADICEKYQRTLKKFFAKDEGLDFKNICDTLLGFKSRIDKGREEGLKKQLNENTQKVFLELSSQFESKKWFNYSEFNAVIKKYNLNESEADIVIKELTDKKLIEKRFYF